MAVAPPVRTKIECTLVPLSAGATASGSISLMASADGSAALHAAVSGDYFDTNNANDTADLVVAVSSTPRSQPPSLLDPAAVAVAVAAVRSASYCSSPSHLCSAPAGALELALDCRHLGSHACGSRRLDSAKFESTWWLHIRITTKSWAWLATRART